AFDDTCTHRGCSLASGKLDGTTVTCPCHGSQFDVTSGAVVRGPATRPVRSRLVEVKGNDLLVVIRLHRHSEGKRSRKQGKRSGECDAKSFHFNSPFHLSRQISVPLT